VLVSRCAVPLVRQQTHRVHTGRPAHHPQPRDVYVLCPASLLMKMLLSMRSLTLSRITAVADLPQSACANVDFSLRDRQPQ